MADKELEKIRPTETKLFIGGREREIKFTFSAWAKLEDKYGNLANIGQLEEDIKARPFHVLPELIYIGLTDKEGVEKDTLLDEYGMEDLQKIAEVVQAALYGSLPTEKKRAVKKAAN